MNNMFDNKIKFCKDKIQQQIKISQSRINDLSAIFEEYFVFETQYRQNDIYLLKRKVSAVNSILTFQTIIYDELDKIISFEYANSDTTGMLSRYGSFYCGDGTLYYSDVLVSYSDEEFFQIILNHILHYINGCFKLNKHNDSIKSLVLISFAHLQLFNFKIKYANQCRYRLYRDPLYRKIIDDFIIFNPSVHLNEYVINNKIRTNYFAIKNDYIYGMEVYITEREILFSDYTTDIYDDYDKTTFEYIKNKYEQKFKLYNKYDNVID